MPPRATPSFTHHTDPLFQEFLEDYLLYCEGEVPLLFTENETKHARLFASANASPYVKDGINNYIVHGDAPAVNLPRKERKRPTTRSASATAKRRSSAYA